MLRVTTDPDRELRFRQIALSNTKNSFNRLGWLDYRLVSVHGDKTDRWLENPRVRFRHAKGRRMIPKPRRT